MNNIPDVLAKTVDAWTGKVLDLALIVLAVGTVAMAFLELLKSVFGARALFHCYAVRAWLVRGRPAAFRELLALTGQDANGGRSLFDQPTNNMMGQIQAAADVALDFPRLYPALYEILARSGLDESPVRGDGADLSDSEYWREQAPRLADPPPGSEDDPAFLTLARGANQARGRIGNLVARRLDGLQTRVTYSWARANQGVALVVGTGFFLYFMSETPGFTEMPYVERFSLAALGGLVAPFSKDLVTTLTSVSARRSS